jgi:HD-GYP domain-containing protein (c-di-GMP phosphodiesterase class II)
MRRVSSGSVKAGMILARDIYDEAGKKIIDAGDELDAKTADEVQATKVPEIFIEDERLDDVVVWPMFSPEHVSKATRALAYLLSGSLSTGQIEAGIDQMVEEPLRAMVREVFPQPLGEISATGCVSQDEFKHAQPTKVACLAILMGMRSGYDTGQLLELGTIALLKDIGYVLLRRSASSDGEQPNKDDARKMRQHPRHGSRMLEQSEGFGEAIVSGVAQHHERWDGSGYPDGLKHEEIAESARIIAIADTYYELVSVKSNRRALMPHEAIEFIMAYSGDMFDPKMVQVFARQVPLYPTGMMVKLSNGESGIISDPNLGHVGRPVVRICYDKEHKEELKPFDRDLSIRKYQDLLITDVMEY